MSGRSDPCGQLRMNKSVPIFLSILLLFSFSLLGGCSTEHQTQSKGFHLPEGDVEVGKNLFVKFDCNWCHSVSGVELPDSGTLNKPPAIMLGGEVNQVQSYGELVTSIIDPEHVISPKYLASLSKKEKKEGEILSPMPGYNQEMSVEQLVDMVAFLHSRYRLIEPDLDDFYYTTP